MPVRKGNDQIGYFFRWGIKGKKYYYVKSSKISMKMAYDKALGQGRAIQARRYYK